MNINNKQIKAIIFSLICTLITVIILITGLTKVVNNTFMDIYQKPSVTNPDIVIVTIDEKSISELGKYDDWNRGYYAKVIDNITQNSKPAVIGLDVLFTGESDSIYDQELINACVGNNVISAMSFVYGDNVDENEKVSGIIDIDLPFDGLLNNTKQGFVDTIEDSIDNKIRRTIPSILYNDKEYDSFSYSIYKQYCNVNNMDIKQYDSNKDYRFKYSSMPNENYSTISFVDLYNGLMPNDLDNAIVLIGAYATGLQDQFYVPITSGKMNGVEIHANIIDAFIKDELINEVSNVLRVIISIVIVLVFSFVLYLLSVGVSGIVSLCLVLVLFLIQTLCFNNNTYIPFNDLILIITIVYISLVGIHYYNEYKEKKKTVDVFKKYVDPNVVDKALKNVNYEINLGGEKRRVACLFVDIRGFTPLSESLEPQDVVSILNEYLDLTTNAIFKNNGTLDKFIGDATMAVFNAPFDLDDYAFKAVKCAIDIASGSKHIEDMFIKKYGKKVSYGIGVNIGDAVVGNIGSKMRMDYTAIGDTINVAARLESNAKPSEILISEALYLEVKDRIDATLVGPLKLKGKANEVIVYKVNGLKEEI